MPRRPVSTTSTSASIDAARTGVLYVNLGTPDSPSVPDVRRFLREFLSDRLVVDVPRILWWPLLHGIILPFRAPRSAHAYASIWTSQGSPLYVISARVGELLQQELGPRFQVELAMRYRRPSIAEGLAKLRESGVRRVIVLTAFPQYSRTTVGTVQAEVERVRSQARLDLELETVDTWHDDAGYVEAVAERCRLAASAAHGVDHWVFSFHGLPERYVKNGDPYRVECERTAELLATRLALPRSGWTLVFQSRFGREPWLQPYADVLVPTLAKRHPRLGIAMPGFTADCLETLEEIGIRLRESFLAAGGAELVVAPCVNDSPTLVSALAAQVRARA